MQGEGIDGGDRTGQAVHGSSGTMPMEDQKATVRRLFTFPFLLRPPQPEGVLVTPSLCLRSIKLVRALPSTCHCPTAAATPAESHSLELLSAASATSET